MSSSLLSVRKPVIRPSEESGDDAKEGNKEMGYQETLMYGRYSKSLGEYAKEEAKRQKFQEKRRRKVHLWKGEITLMQI